MRFSFTEEQEELRNIVRRFLDAACPSSRVRQLMVDETGHDADMWSTAAEQIGLPALWVPEAFGGAGYGFLELAVVLEEWGRAMAPGPFLASAVLVPAMLLSAGDEATREELLPGIAAGETIATVALHAGMPGATDGAISAREDGDSWVLTGEAPLVLDGHLADVVLVPARTRAGFTLFAVRAGAAGLTRAPLPMLDQTRRFARLQFVETPADPAGPDGQAASGVARVGDVAAVALAMEQVGAAQRCLEMSVDYAKTRVQFGRPIGSFQAIAHRCAEMLLRVESARSAAYYAAWTVDAAPDRLPLYASVAKSYASEAFAFVAGETIQVHGGIGFTWEHDAHLYFKRAKSSEHLFGSPTSHRERVGAAAGI